MKISLQNQAENFCSSTETDWHFLRYAPDEAIGKICIFKHESHALLARCSRAEECRDDTQSRDPRCLCPSHIHFQRRTQRSERSEASPIPKLLLHHTFFEEQACVAGFAIFIVNLRHGNGFFM